MSDREQPRGSEDPGSSPHGGTWWSRRWLRYALGIVVVLVGASTVLAGWVYEDFHAAPYAEMKPAAGVGGLSAQQCRICHEEIYEEWAQSGHARAFIDPLYQAELQHQRVTFVCHRCHTPLTQQRPQEVTGLWLAWPRVVPRAWANDDFDPELQKEGVTCVACHQVDGHMVGPIADPQAPPHPTRVGELRAVDTCARCHQFGFERIGALDRPIIDTVTEWEEYRADGGQERCADCHMPIEGERAVVRDGPSRPHTNHRLRGPFDLDMVREGVKVDAPRLGREGAAGVASLTLENGTGHRLPTAEPERYLRVSLSALDANGVELSVDEQRFERPVDVAKLVELGADTTLAPHERRALSLRIEPLPEHAVQLVLAVDFFLWHDNDVATQAGLVGDARRHRVFERTLRVGP